MLYATPTWKKTDKVSALSERIKLMMFAVYKAKIRNAPQENKEHTTYGQIVP